MDTRLSRRHLLGMGAAGLGTGLIGLPSFALANPKPRKPKNIIFCVCDGMAASVPTMADHLQQILHGRTSYWRWLMRQDFVVNGMQDVRSLNSVVTDSAASASAWGCGRQIWNGQLNMFPDGTELQTLTNLMQGAGMRTGLVTTARITHATPAGFAVNSIERGLEDEIAEKFLACGVDVLMGGGNRHFAADKRKDKTDLYKKYEAKGYAILRSRDETMLTTAGKILGIYADSHVPYTVDRNHSIELQRSAPTLAQMTQTAIRALNRGSGGFLLQVEGARVDHGGHGNDLAGMIYDQIAFEEAVKVAVDFAVDDGDTLVIITADHACGGVALNGAGSGYGDSNKGLETLAAMTASYERILPEIGSKPNRSHVQDVIETRLKIKLTNDEAQAVVDAAAGNSPFKLSSFRNGTNAALADVLGNHTKVGFTSGNHTGEWVMLTALGPGKEACAGLVQNTSLFDLMVSARDLRVNNPTMSYADAARHYEKLKEKTQARVLDRSEDEFDHGALAFDFERTPALV